MRAYTLVPYTTLFRSGDARSVEKSDAAAIQGECCCGEEVSERIGRSDLAGRREAGAREEIVLISSRDRSSAPLKTHHQDRKSTRLNSSHLGISYAVFC